MTLSVDDFGNALQSVAIAYGRRHSVVDSPLSDEDREKQRRIHITYSENRYTNPILLDDNYRTPLPCESRTYEILKARPSVNLSLVTHLFRFDEMLRLIAAASDGTHDIPYEDIVVTLAIDGHPYRRLIEHVRSLFRRDDLTGSLPLSKLEPLALPFESYKLAFTPGLLNGVYGERITEAMLKTEGRYVHSEGDDNWWIPSGKMFFLLDSNHTASQEFAYARQHFFLPHRYRNPFYTSEVSTESFVSYDAYDLLMLETRDALDNRVTVGERDTSGSLTKHGNDYRVLQPRLTMDPNRNRTEVAFDVLGMVVGTAVMGKPEENLGDSLDDFEADLSEAVTLDHLQNPLSDPHSILNRASTRLVYDLFAYQRTKNQHEPQSAVVYALVRETHDADLAPGQKTKIQHSFSYSDGFGREIQKKIQAEPGKVDGHFTPSRWVSSGWTIFNNKGKPVRQYEPFFSDTHRFEFAKQQGVSPILFYDPIGRVVATLNPNHTWGKVVFDPWRQESWDVNDTVLLDPDADADVQGFFRALPKSDYLPTWYQERINKPKSDLERQAAEKTSHHANTPTLAYFDTLGRPFLSIADNGSAGKYVTRTELDIEGNQRAVIDAKDRVVMRYDYDMLGTRIHQASMEAGERWMLNDEAGKPIRAWDSRGHAFRTEFDPLRRPLRSFVVGAVAHDPSQEILYERTIYGETMGEALNYRGRVYQVFDSAGFTTSKAYDFKGNLLHSGRQLVQDYKNTPDWFQQVALEYETFASYTVFDALNRPVSLTTPDKSVIRPAYNEANLLDRLMVNLRGAETATPFVANINYNAKGQRERIEYSNHTKTEYAYDEKTFRLITLNTLRGSTVLQDLNYTYDPAGNITHIRDDAQQTVFFRNRRVEASTDYVYDAIYRLIQATGREHLGLASDGCPFGPVSTSHTDQPRVGLLHPGDGHAMGIYQENYEYDAVGNFLCLLHHGTDSNHAGWKREYQYHESSLLNPAQNSNRLSGTRVGEAAETYTYDIHGNMLQMPHLAEMAWDFKDQLQQVDLGGGGRAYYVYDAAGQRVRKVHEHNGSTVEERIYLGGFEVYRKRISGETKLERETLHIMDDKQRIALVETKTQDVDACENLLNPIIRYQLGNHLGSASLELDFEGAVISYEEYYPFGSTSYQAGSGAAEVSLKHYRYTGKERDEETGLYYHGARYYAPWLARWTSADPRGMVDGTNVFAYARNNPLIYADPTGTECDPTTQSCVDPTEPTAREEALQQSLPEEERYLPPASLPESPAPPPSTPSPGSPSGRVIEPPPPVSPTDYTLYVPQGFVYSQREAAIREVEDSSNPWYVRTGMFLLGTAATPLALAEEYIARPITNIPFVMHNAGIGIGEHIGRGYLWAQQGEYGEATVEGLETVKSFSHGFVAGASVGAPIAGALESRAAASTTVVVEESLATRGTGAFLEGAGGGTGLGKLADKSIQVSEKGLTIVEEHLAQFGAVPENTAMIGRLQSALSAGERISGADASFYMHEVSEATMMGRGMSYEAAHAGALGKYGVSPYSVYHPEVIQSLPGSFNANWLAFWGLR